MSKVLLKWYLEVGLAHGILRITEEILGLYIVSAAGTNILPEWAPIQPVEVVDAH